MDQRQEFLDRFYFERGPCCAGCDWWRSLNSIAGECTRSAPVKPKERYAMLGIQGSSILPTAGHVLTKRDHFCGDFKDEFDWTSLPVPYRKRIGQLCSNGQELEKK
jgi:hypothetical protein